MDNNIDLNLYKIFMVVAKHQSISKAAEELYVSQPAVSYSIKQLEQELGVKLFERTTKGVIPTLEAKKLLFYVENAYNTLFTGKKMLHDSSDLITGEVKIGVPTHIGTFLVSKVIQKFNEQYPGIKFHIVNRSTSDMVQLLEKRELDLIIDSYPIDSYRNDMCILDLMDIENCFAGNKKYKAISNDIIDIKNMAKYPLLLPSKKTSTRNILDTTIKSKVEGLDAFIEVSTTEMMLDLVNKGLGIGYFAKLSVENEIMNKKIFEIHTNVELPRTKLCIAYIDQFLTSAPKEFIEILKKEIEIEKNKAKKELRILVTQNCIYNCDFCHKEGLLEQKDVKMEADDIAYLYEITNKGIGIKGVQITGGEPLYRKDIIEIVKKLKQKDANVTLTTNGFFLTEKMDVAKYLDKINISLHTLDEEKYEKISTMKTSYNKVINNIKKLRVKYPLLNIGLNMTLINGLNSDVEDIEKMIRFASSINASLKIVEFYPELSNKYISIDTLIPFLESKGFTLMKNTFRKKIYTDNKMEIKLTKCTCSVVDKIENKEDACRNNNDIYISPSGTIRLCRHSNDEIDILDCIKQKNDEQLIHKLELGYENLGKQCIL